MAATVKFLFALVLLSLVAHGGYSQCPSGSLLITQTLTGKTIGTILERKVTISNTCPCAQLNIKLTCSGFTSVEQVDPSILSTQTGSKCSLNNGNPVFRTSPVSFNYASATQYPFKVSFTQIGCS